MSNIKPINIASKNISGKCDLKCEYLFLYEKTNLVAKNEGVMIVLTGDESNSTPVRFNKQKYRVGKIILVSPSIHLFNNVKTNAEILIVHTPILGGKPLIVCVPIIQSGDSSSATDVLTQIITAVSNNAPSQGETTNINISSFTLNTIVPKKPFYAYMGPDIHKSPAAFIVYGYLDAIPLTSDTLTTLSNIIQPFHIQTVGSNLFYNTNGPNHYVDEEGIYISCKPTGSSEESVPVDTGSDSNDTNYNLGDIFQNSTVKLIVKIIVGIIIFILFFMLINQAYSFAIMLKPLKLTGVPD
jgi:hypothetical protein